jgi:hypothetical protein
VLNEFAGSSCGVCEGLVGSLDIVKECARTVHTRLTTMPPNE